MTKAIFFDVDGTLVSFKTHQISPAVRQALQALRERGIKLFLSTGRHLAMLDPVRQVFDFDGYVTLSGQYCTAQGQVLRSTPMPPEAVEELVAAAGGTVTGRMAVLAEGGAADRTDIKFLGKLPVFNADGTVKG